MNAKETNISVVMESCATWKGIADKLDEMDTEVFVGWSLYTLGATTIGLLQFHRKHDDEGKIADARALALAFGGDWVDDFDGCWKSENTILGPDWKVYLHRAEIVAPRVRHIDLSLPVPAIGQPACGDS